MILAFPSGSSGPPVQPDQVDAFNAALAFLGVDKISTDVLAEHNKLVVLGIPKAGGGTGWSAHGGAQPEALKGWLMTDQVGGYRFQPDRPKFDTRASHTATSNTMNLGGQQFTATLPAGATGGFQVQYLDPVDFRPVAQAVFPTNGVADPVAAITAMANYLDGGRWGPHLVVQSIGTVGRPAPPSSPYDPDLGAEAWIKLGQELAAYGANPHTFFNVNGSYAFFGGVKLGRSEVAQSSTGIVTDPTTNPRTTQSGTVQGRLSLNSEGYVVPASADPHDKLSYELYDIAFAAPTPWKYTEEGDADYDPDYEMAMTYITKSLTTTKSGWGNDLRVIYGQDLNRDWTTEHDDLATLRYPADQLDCSQPRGPDKQPNPGYTKRQFCNLVNAAADGDGVPEVRQDPLRRLQGNAQPERRPEPGRPAEHRQDDPRRRGRPQRRGPGRGDRELHPHAVRGRGPLHLGSRGRIPGRARADRGARGVLRVRDVDDCRSEERRAAQRPGRHEGGQPRRAGRRQAEQERGLRSTASARSSRPTGAASRRWARTPRPPGG